MERSVVDALVQTASTLAAIQIEGVEDQTGFSNADKFVGAFLAATVAADPTDEDNVRILAALVSKYRRQSEGMVGVDMHSRFKELAKDAKITTADRDRARHIVLAAPGVHPRFGPQVVFAWNGFKYDYADAVKACGAKAFKDAGGQWKWAVRAENAHDAAARLIDLGATIRGSLDVPEDLTVEKAPDALPNRIRVKKLDGEYMGLGWDYGNHARWNQIAKALPKRRFDWGLKLWVVPIKDLAIAQDAFYQAGADVSEFRALAPQAPTLAQLMPDEPNYAERANPATVAAMYDFQKVGFNFLTKSLYDMRRELHSVEPKGVILGDDMGLGKTIQSITAANAIADPEEKILIVCPANMKLKWRREIYRWGWGPEIEDVEIAYGSDVSEARWMIVNYDILPRVYDRLKEIGFAVLICDEAHYTKNRESNRSKMVVGGVVPMPHEPTEADPRKKVRRKLEGLAELATKRVFLLTGTPLTNRPKDLFNLLKAVKHPLGRNWRFFGQRYCDPVFNGFGTTYDGGSNLAELRERIAPIFLQRKKEDHLNLPPKTRDWMPVEVDLTKYQKIMDEYEARRLAGELSRTEHHLALITEARVCCATAKIPRTIEFVENAVEQGEKVIVFTGRTNVLKEIVDYFGDKAVKIDGSSSKTQREDAEKRFMTDDSVRVIVGNLIAMGVGLDLTAATQVVNNDLDWVPANHLQAEDRAYRIGQDKPVNVTYILAAGTFDEDLSVLLEEKFDAVKAFEGYDQGSLFNALVERLRTAPQNAGVKALKAARKAAAKAGAAAAA